MKAKRGNSVASTGKKPIKSKPKKTEGRGKGTLVMGREDALRLYRSMFRMRRFEMSCYEMYLGGRIPGMSPHLYVGEEAVAASICSFLTSEDYIVSNHRGHGHCLGKGAKMDRMLAEIMGKSTGYCSGRGGSMHIADVKLGNLGANGIVGAGVPIAVGAAFSIAYRGTSQIAVVFFGDAASGQGTFHEGVNMAACMGLPVLFVCENNQYGLSTPIKKMCPTSEISDKAHGYGIEHATVDGMDAEVCYLAAQRAVSYVKKERRPYLVEFVTYRFLGHGASDNRSYRTREEEEKWKKRSPVENFRLRLEKDYGVELSAISKIEEEAEAELAAAQKFAEESPEPLTKDALRNVFKPTEAVRQFNRGVL